MRIKKLEIQLNSWLAISMRSRQQPIKEVTLGEQVDQDRREHLMIEMDWGHDERTTDVNKYLVDPDSNEGRRKAFLGGWTRFLNQGGSDYLKDVTWVRLGMVYASILDDISLDRKKDIYRLLLGQYLSMEKVSHWTEDQREQALRLAEKA